MGAAGQQEAEGGRAVLSEAKVEELAGQLLESAGEQQLEQVVGRLVGTASDPGFSGTPTATALR